MGVHWRDSSLSTMDSLGQVNCSECLKLKRRCSLSLSPSTVHELSDANEASYYYEKSYYDYYCVILIAVRVTHCCVARGVQPASGWLNREQQQQKRIAAIRSGSDFGASCRALVVVSPVAGHNFRRQEARSRRSVHFGLGGLSSALTSVFVIALQLRWRPSSGRLARGAQRVAKSL